MKASFVSRISAFIVDYLIIYIVLMIIFSGFFTSNDFNKRYEELEEKYYSNEITKEEYTDNLFKINYDSQKSKIVINIISTAVYIGYYMVFAYLNNGQTLGKKIFKIKVVNNKNNNKLGLKNIIIRSLFIYGIITNIFNIIFVNLLNYKYFGYINIFITYFEIFFIILCTLMILHKKDGRGLHDLIAGTYVIREEKK